MRATPHLSVVFVLSVLQLSRNGLLVKCCNCRRINIFIKCHNCRGIDIFKNAGIVTESTSFKMLELSRIQHFIIAIVVESTFKKCCICRGIVIL
jgi:hypothetical protein